MPVENALELEVGDNIRAVFDVIVPYALTEGKFYRIRSVTPLYRGGESPDYFLSEDSSDGPLCNVMVGIIDDSRDPKDVPYMNFRW